MSTNSNIEWTTHTFNPWWGCTKVHAGCTNCYAEAFDKRVGGSHWGNSPRRMVLGEWGKPAKWNAVALAENEVHSVFCASMCDLFEDYDGPVVDQRGKPLWIDHDGRTTNWNTDNPVTLDWLRSRVFTLINNTPSLRWLLLTKRPENIMRMVPKAWLEQWPANVWTGTSPCDQATAVQCIHHLICVPGKRFLSCEPLLGTLDLTAVEFPTGKLENVLDCRVSEIAIRAGIPKLNGIDWVISGAESRGTRSGRFSEGYVSSAREIMRQCKSFGVPFFNKQMPIGGRISKDMAEWPEDLRVREVPQ